MTVRALPMWIVWLEDPSGKYGDHKAFYAVGHNESEAEAQAIASRPGSTIKHPTRSANFQKEA